MDILEELTIFPDFCNIVALTTNIIQWMINEYWIDTCRLKHIKCFFNHTAKRICSIFLAGVNNYIL